MTIALLALVVLPVLAQDSGEIELAVTRQPEKIFSGKDVATYFSEALQATYRSEGGGRIKAVFRAWLAMPDGKLVNQCVSRPFEMTPEKMVGADALRSGFDDCFPTHFKNKPDPFQIRDLGVAVNENPNLGLWDPKWTQEAHAKLSEADHFVIIAVTATEREVAEWLRIEPHVFGTVYSIPALDGSNK